MVVLLLALLSSVPFLDGPTKNIVMVVNNNKADSSMGTGFYIDKNHVLTAEHVVEGMKDKNDLHIQCFDEKETKIAVKNVKVEKLKDIALLETDGICPEQQILKIAKKHEPVANTVYAIGCPDGMCGMVTKGIVSSYFRDPQSKILELYADLKIWYGSSGGPLLNEKGEVVGLLKQISSQSVVLPRRGKIFEVVSQNYGVYVPAMEILQFLAENEDTKGK
jgi:S1-C subfamily serine protease